MAAIADAGRPARPDELVDSRCARRRPTTPDAPTSPSPRSASPSGPRAIAAPRSTRPSTRTTSWPPRPPSAPTARAGDERTAVHGPRHARALGAGLPDRARGAGRRRRRCARRQRRRLHADAGHRRTPSCTWNRAHPEALADGIVVTPSHNPPEDGGFKYNPPSGGPADADVTRAIQDAANELLRSGLDGVARVQAESARGGAARHDFMGRLRRRPHRASSTCRPSPRAACASGSTHSGAPRSPTGPPSPSGTASTSPSRTTAWTRPSAS